MSDSNDSSDDEPVQEAMAIESDHEDEDVEEAQVVDDDDGDDDDDDSQDSQAEGQIFLSPNDVSVDASADAATPREALDMSNDGEDDSIDNDSDSKDDDEDEEDGVMAAVVLEEDADDEMEDVAQAEVVEDIDPTDDQPNEQDISAEAGEATKSSKPKTSPRKVKKKKKKAKRSRGQQGNFGGIPLERLDAASTAREVLLDSVPRLPAVLSDALTVRSFGRLHVQDSLESPFSTAASLYPVGFSCDRFEFSPVHGRVLKMRCTILDGSKLNGASPKPVFRVMWGQGVDDDSSDVDYPYDPFTSSAPIAKSDNVDAVAMPFSDDNLSSTGVPEVGMKVKVRFEEEKWYGGTLVHVGDDESAKHRNGDRVEICIQYDDGSTEDAIFPDPDIRLHLPGEEDEITPDGVATLTELHGKSVTSVTGDSPIEAWGKALLALGLIDEIIFESAMNALSISRDEGRAEAADKMKTLKLQRQQARHKTDSKPSQGDEGEEQVGVDSSPKSQTSESRGPSPDPSNGTEDVASKEESQSTTEETEEQNENGAPSSETAEEATEEEKALRSEVEAVRAELENLQESNREALIALTDARTKKMGPLFCNPFREKDQATTQHWLSTVIRKEKTKMGSTGNRKKIVTRTDLLERNDTFYNTELETLLEGLPGSEYCHSYVFQDFRSGGVAGLSQAWVHEAEIRQEKLRERQLKSAREAKAKASQQLEREIKKRKREEDRDARKRMKIEEAEQKKKARVEDRMSRLSVQIDERLSKEACFQRERVVLALSRGLGKEFARRRRAAEVISGNLVINSETKNKSSGLLHSDDFNGVSDLPPLSQTYDEEIVRVWDFISSFGSVFTTLGFMSSLPSLDSLQKSIDSIREGSSSGSLAKEEAIVSLVDVAVALSKPLAASLTKLLFSSLIALNPGLQKDYGASFFAEINATSKESINADGEKGEMSFRSLLPVNKMTWQEVARVAFLSEAFGELGFSRQETAHQLRGYRSGGHPNSKEAKRLRRTEDFSLALLRQIMSQSAEGTNYKSDKAIHRERCDYTVRVQVPCSPSSSPSEWIFYLHNIKALPSNAITSIRANVTKALALQKSNANMSSSGSILSDLTMALNLLGKDGKQESGVKAKRVVLDILDRVTGESYSKESLGHVVYRDCRDLQTQKRQELAPVRYPSSKFFRQRMGLLDSLVLTGEQYKALVDAREEYMTDALRLKEEMDNKESKDEEDEDEEDEDDLDDDGDSKQSNDDSKSAKNAVIDTDVSAAKGDVTGEGTTAPMEKKSGGADNDVHADSVPASSKGLQGKTVTDVVANGDKSTTAETFSETVKLGKSTQFDEFCEDMPDAHELVRRCLAVLRTLCQTGPAEPFLYPVDPQGYPGYYEALIKPMCLREVGRVLQEASRSADPQSTNYEETVEGVITQFGRNVRLINQNCSCYSNVGASIISSADEMLRIFERLFLEWVLAPENLLPPLDRLDDDRCVDYHPSDEDSLVLLCDGCEGKYNMSRLNPPVLEVPKGDWFCPRCVNGRCFEDLDPRIGREVPMSSLDQEGVEVTGVINRSTFRYPEGPDSKPSLMYMAESPDGVEEMWTLDDIDRLLSQSGKPVPKVRCLEAVAESPGYDRGGDRGLHADIVPGPLNPRVSDAAAQATSSSVAFRDIIAGAGSLLLLNPEEMSASEWSQMLILLTMKCASSEMMLGLASKMENDAAEDLATQVLTFGKVSEISEILAEIEDDGESEENSVCSTHESMRSASKLSERAKASDSGLEDNAVMVDVDASAAVIVEANSVEIIADEDVGENAAGNGSMVAEVVPAAAVRPLLNASNSEEDARREGRAAALAEKEKRHKAREDSIAAQCIKNQLRSVAASFEEDAVSQVVDSSMASTELGLSFSSCRCRALSCHFCGLSDIALGTPLLRVPDDQQWNDFVPHAFRFRRTHLVAECWNSRQKADLESESVILSPSRARRQKRLVSVSLRVGGEILSRKSQPGYFDDVADGGMLLYLPRNEEGFQMELQCRLDSGLPFSSGSLSAHECCAIAAHEARKEQVVQLYKENRSLLVEKDCGMACGRTLSLGTDAMGRSYWKFNSDPNSLFVSLNNCDSFPSTSTRKWHRYVAPEDIASVIVCLGKQKVAQEIKRTYPESAGMIQTGKWSQLLQMRVFPLCAAGTSVLSTNAAVSNASKETLGDDKLSEDNVVDSDEEPYEEGEDVLVESSSGKLLWDAKVIGVSKSRAKDKVNAYRVRYPGWSSRFDEWVQPLRVVEANENNLQVQEELLEEMSSSKHQVPPSLESMLALEFLNKMDRSRGQSDPPSFMHAARVSRGAPSNAKAFAVLKAAILLVEAALPLGAIDNSESGPWRPELVSEWRSIVMNARGPSKLMRCVILLEDAIDPDWFDEDVGHMLSCMPIGWKAIGEASTSSLALRIFLIDRGIKYDVIDKHKFAPKRKK